MSVVANDVAFASLDKTHFPHKVKIRLISQLIKEISSVLRKQCKYLNDINISAFFVPLPPVTDVIF